MGYDIGRRTLELMCIRDSKPSRRDRSPISALQYVHTHLWKQITGHAASGLEKSSEHEDEYFLIDDSPITDTFISIPTEASGLHCSAFLAGIIAGALESQGLVRLLMGW
jgi:hypothetical protein